MKKAKLTYTWINPNRPEVIERMLQQIIVEKILSQHEKDEFLRRK